MGWGEYGADDMFCFSPQKSPARGAISSLRCACNCFYTSCFHHLPRRTEGRSLRRCKFSRGCLEFQSCAGIQSFVVIFDVSRNFGR